ncbi:MAG TPA: replication-associated recombination protein A [Bacteroidales bacterium]|nr:replication-associated recombination protein A [Bacteroidales bacterium]
MGNLNIPLAEKLRPKSLDEYLGQDHLLGKGSVLRKSIESGNIPSMIFWGPPGVGKTTLAFLISRYMSRQFFTLSAINSGVKEVRAVIETARESGSNAILFIDEIHRFSKSQQDSLLGAVEKGTITLIGATTENPSFEVITPLLSRCLVYILKELGKQELLTLLDRGKNFLESETMKEIIFEETEALLRVSGGDARKLYNALELTVGAHAGQSVVITNQAVLSAVQQNLALYDKGGEMHYDIISAFIKSIRGSDPNAAVYYLARMLEGGEDPKFIARRMVILASEDIGNANPNALVLATSCFQAITMIGMPEGRLILSQTAIYLATSPKSNASYLAIDQARESVKSSGDLPVPLALRNTPTKLMKDIGYGQGYKYAHDFEQNFANMEFLPDKLKGFKFYEPGNNPRENDIRTRLRTLWKQKYGY